MGGSRASMGRDASASHLASMLVASAKDQKYAAACDIERAKVAFIDHDREAKETGIEIQRTGQVIDFQAGFQEPYGWRERRHGKDDSQDVLSGECKECA